MDVPGLCNRLLLWWFVPWKPLASSIFSPLFGNTVLNGSWFVRLTSFSSVYICLLISTWDLLTYKCLISYLPYFISQTALYFYQAPLYSGTFHGCNLASFNWQKINLIVFLITYHIVLELSGFVDFARKTHTVFSTEILILRAHKIPLLSTTGVFLAVTKHPSVCPSHLFHYVPIIASSWNFQELLPMTEKMSIQRSRSQRSKSILAVSGL